jgi:hypothetical protein
MFSSRCVPILPRSCLSSPSHPIEYDVAACVLTCSLAQALPTCVSADHPAKYEPVKAGDYVKAKLEASYKPKNDV